MTPSLRAYLERNARWLVAGALLTFLSSFGQTFFISIFAGEIRREFGLSHGEWGGIYSLGTLLSAGLMVWAGMASDRFRVRTLGPVILTGLAVACCAMALNPSLAFLVFVVLMLRFFGQGMCSHMATVAMARWFQATRGRALSVATLGYSLGEAVLPLVFVFALGSLDWRVLWLVCAAICLCGIPVLMSLLRQERTPQSIAETRSSPGMGQRHWTRREALSHPLFWFMMPTILGPSAFMTALFFHQVHLAGIKSWTHVEFVALIPVYTVVSIFSMLTTGWALDKLGTARLMPWFQLPFVAGFVVFAFGSGPDSAFLGFVLLGLSTGANATLPAAFWAEFYGTAHIGAIKSLATALMVLGSAIGPGITGVLIDLGTGLEAQFLGFSVFFLICCGLAWFGIRKAAPDPA